MSAGVYHNSYFDLALPLPLGWRAETPPHADWLLDHLISLLAAGDIRLKNADAPPQRRHFLLRSSSDRNFLEIAAAEVGEQPSLVWGRDCLKRIPVILDAGRRSYRITQPPHPVVLDGVKFDAMSFTVRLQDGELHQSVYAVVRWGYALVFVAGSPSPTELKKIESSLSRVSFKTKS